MDNGVRIGTLQAPSSAHASAGSSAHASATARAVQNGSTNSLIRLWPLLVAGSVMAGLLLSLATVLRQSMTQAQARHATTAARADANFRCNTIAGREERKDCRSRAEGLLVDTASSSP